MEIYCCTSPVNEEASSSNVRAHLCTDDWLTGLSVEKHLQGLIFSLFQYGNQCFVNVYWVLILGCLRNIVLSKKANLHRCYVMLWLALIWRGQEWAQHVQGQLLHTCIMQAAGSSHVMELLTDSI